MRTSGAPQLLIAVCLLAVALSPLATSVEYGTDASAGVTAPRFAPSAPGGQASPDADVPTMDHEVRIVAKLKDDAEIPSSVRRKYGGVYTREGTRRLSGRVSLSDVAAVSARPGVISVRIKQTTEITDRRIADGVEAIGAQRLHERGMTGENVTVGIVDAGFAVGHRSIADHVGAYRAFSSSGPRVHGTAVASVVADTAPGANLHLAAVGSTTTPAEYRSAVRWLRRSGADVIVDAGSYFGRGASGSIAAIAANASREVAFVTSAGNYAHRHWSGVVAGGNGSRWVSFGDDRSNYLGASQRVSGRVTVGLRWNGSGDYDLYLFRDTPAGDWKWAASTDGTDAEHLSTVVPRGRYYVAVERNGTAGNLTPHRLDVFANRVLEKRTPAGSLAAPATAEGVVVVGAAEGTRVRSFSSRGPTPDGRLGVDLVAPDDVAFAAVDPGGGTSFSAPYVAGTIALLKGEYPRLAAPEIGRAVVRSASDVAADGPDPISGYGLIDAPTAARMAKKLATRRRPPSPEPWRFRTARPV